MIKKKLIRFSSVNTYYNITIHIQKYIYIYVGNNMFINYYLIYYLFFLILSYMINYDYMQTNIMRVQ